jgi:hypothetical protein
MVFIYNFYLLISIYRYLAALESISALGFAGKSGSVLLKSADGLLVLKTISKDEAKFLRKIMPQILTCIFQLCGVGEGAGEGVGEGEGEREWGRERGRGRGSEEVNGKGGIERKNNQKRG